MEIVGAETWIMHGTLLAWWWNQKVGKLSEDPNPADIEVHVLTIFQTDLSMGQ